MIRRSTNELSIRPKLSSKTMAVAVVIAGILIAAALYFTYTSGIKSGHKQYAQDQLLIERLNNTIIELRAELNSGEDGLIFAQRQQQIQQEAYKQLSNAYANSEQKNRELGSRLDFYRSIISPESAQSGPAIQAFDSMYDSNGINFSITLVQAIKHKHQVRGNLRVSLVDGENVIGQWPVSSPRSVSYQYFEKISGSIETPSQNNNISALKLKVEFALQTGATLEQWYDLPSLDKQIDSNTKAPKS